MPDPATDEVMSRATALHHSGKPVEAAALYRQVLERDPNHPRALHHLGVALYQRGDAATDQESRSIFAVRTAGGGGMPVPAGRD